MMFIDHLMAHLSLLSVDIPNDSTFQYYFSPLSSRRTRLLPIQMEGSKNPWL